MIKSIKAVIFDLDGVIVDTAKYHYTAWNWMAESLGCHISEEQNHLLKGVSRMESLDLILKMGGIEKSQEERLALAYAKNEHYTQLIANLDRTEILHGVVSLLDDLADNGCRIALGSASKNSVPILTALDLIDRFEVIIDGTKTTKSKPDPQVFLLGAQALDLPPADCLVVEDSIKGLQAAITGGFKTLGIGEDDGLQIADRVLPDLSGSSYQSLCKTYS